MPSVALHLLVTGSLYELFRSLDLSQSPCTGFGTGNLLLYKHHIVYSHTWALLGITQKQRDRGDTELVAAPVC